MSKKLTTEGFIQKAQEVHSDDYDYSETEYIDCDTKVKIICRSHGPFWQRPINHLKGQGCPVCGKTKKAVRRRKPLEVFIKEAEAVHNHKYDYSDVKYVNTNTCVDIICPSHGVFRQTPKNHLNGHGCPYCAGKHKTTDMLIEEFKSVHGERYDYSEVKYANAKEKVCIICREHGPFYQTPNDHLMGKGCPRCVGQQKSVDQIVAAFRKVHGDKYDYSQMNYVNAHTKIMIGCRKHNYWFEQTPNAHLNGNGCPKCGQRLSHAEDEIYAFVKELYPDAIRNDRVVLDGQELDIFIPSLKLSIEYNGLIWHSEAFGRGKNYHLNKTLLCEKQGITLIHIFADEWCDNKDIVLSKISHLLGYDDRKKIGARQCEIRPVDSNIAKAFLNKNHIQGSGKSNVTLGAFYREELVGVMTFLCSNKKRSEWVLSRFATSLDYRCVGIGGKLFKHFTHHYAFSTITTFADRRWTSTLGTNLYDKMGFTLCGVSRPDYRYVNNVKTERKHKFNFRKQRLHKKYGLPLTMTEYEMSKKLGYHRIWDCGLLKYVFRNKEDDHTKGFI